MSEKYVRLVVKKLKCSKGKREEIRKQLEADVRAEAENGEQLEDIVERMGSPEEIAEEFNSSFWIQKTMTPCRRNLPNRCSL